MQTKLAIFAALMLFTGSINTIATKMQDTTVVGHHHGVPLTFKHPAVQSACMFAGEFLCLLLYIAMQWHKQRNEPPADRLAGELAFELPPDTQRHSVKTFVSFALPAICDATATTLLNLGLYFTFASTYQMLRGTLVLWAGLLTVVILKRRLHSHHWFGMVLITAGAALVGASSVIADRMGRRYPHRTNHHRSLLMLESSVSRHGGGDDEQAASAPLLGDVFVILAQLFAATQFIVEEKFLKGYRVPALLAVGLEGFWGLVISAAALPAVTYLRGSDGLPFDDVPGAWREVCASWQLQASVIASIISIAFFNFFGITVTKKLSGAARATIDACRTLFVWIFSVLVHWERFHALQVLGFVVLLCGTSVYNELLKSFLPSAAERRRRLEELQEPLLGDAALTWQHQTPSAAVPVPGWGRPPLPPSRPRAMGSPYTMARSVRMPPGVFSPHSMASNFPGFDSERSTAPPSADPTAHSGRAFEPAGEAAGEAAEDGEQPSPAQGGAGNET